MTKTTISGPFLNLQREIGIAPKEKRDCQIISRTSSALYFNLCSKFTNGVDQKVSESEQFTFFAIKFGSRHFPVVFAIADCAINSYVPIAVKKRVGSLRN